ncbi:Ubiquinol-cytochrome c reductase complex 6.7 kDa protein [Rhynchospora pubera]|uniref:Ubiquinol-cytochrome c reductase complex 6.7 kDa protein n=1 Tax=Rhynchospora pubera TaxID=906938 RepID=A0AAV8ECJ5_9POAL|nr:Ubiquinol-cytochrome c reductase complex 6.7 kDa protein [Rhynchospora pubera]
MPSVHRSAPLLKSLPPHRRPQTDDVVAAVGWGTAAAATALWLIQPFDWLKEKLFKKPEPEALDLCAE